MNGKKLKVAIPFLLLIFSGLFVWELYYRITFDHYLEGTPTAYSINQDTHTRIKEALLFTEAENFIKKNTLKITKKNGTYYWVNNKNKELIKTEIVRDITPNSGWKEATEAKFLVFTNPEGYGSIQIRVDVLGVDECEPFILTNYYERRLSRDGESSYYTGITKAYETPLFKFKCFLDNPTGAPRF